ncbi:hypothetical protein [Mesorhizobium sp.]|uniref:hypothetical protein n=1 Tax=Mesorhizobium sp. TaxID=1871066 RepID=UPI000FE4F826|nr:hypothetical protein [Mesorhizobium sp.]RWE35587.1 MAG: hypothetical protein EOS77_06990 [Mesorhizobium sp.]
MTDGAMIAGKDRDQRAVDRRRRPPQAASQAAISSTRPSEAFGLSALPNSTCTRRSAAPSAGGSFESRLRKSSKGVGLVMFIAAV